MTECSESGYWCCEENYYNYGCATAYAKVYWRFVDEKGNIIGWNGTAIENLYVEIRGIGDKFYLIEGASSWDEYTCDENGCSGPHVWQVSSGLTLLCPAGYTYTYPVACGVWDKDYCGYDWAWTQAARGWVGTGNFFNIKVVPEVPQGVRASVNANYTVPSENPQFDIWILYGIDVDGTIERFAESGYYEWAYKQFNVSAPGGTMIHNVDLSGDNVANFPSGTYDALVRILKPANGDRLCDWEIYNNVFTR